MAPAQGWHAQIEKCKQLFAMRRRFFQAAICPKLRWKYSHKQNHQGCGIPTRSAKAVRSLLLLLSILSSFLVSVCLFVTLLAFSLVWFTSVLVVVKVLILFTRFNDWLSLLLVAMIASHRRRRRHVCTSIVYLRIWALLLMGMAQCSEVWIRFWEQISGSSHRSYEARYVWHTSAMASSCISMCSCLPGHPVP